MASSMINLLFEDADLRQIYDAGDQSEHDGAVVAAAAREEVDEAGEFEDEPEVGADVYYAVVFWGWWVRCVGLLVLVLGLGLGLVLRLSLVLGLSTCWLLLLCFVGAGEEVLVVRVVCPVGHVLSETSH